MSTSIRSSFTLVMSLGIILVVSMACVPRTPELPVMTEPLSTVTPQIGETPTPEPMAGAPKEERTAAPVEPQLTAVQNMNVRSGPGVQYPVVGYLPEGKRAIISVERLTCCGGRLSARRTPLEMNVGFPVRSSTLRPKTPMASPLLPCHHSPHPLSLLYSRSRRWPFP